MKPVTVAAFNSPEEAEPLRQRLIAAGIQAQLRHELESEGKTPVLRPSAGVRIEVPREHFEAALRFVYDWNVEEASSMGAPALERRASEKARIDPVTTPRVARP
jgi:hypothetical protein